MKKTIYILLFCFLSVIGFSQTGYINTATTGRNNTLVKSLGYLGADSTFILLQGFTDTASANFSGASLYTGSFIRVGTQIWHRTLSPARWNLFQSGITGGTVTNISGVGALSFTNATTTPVGTIDTSWSGGLTTRLTTRRLIDSLGILKVNYTDTATQLSGYVRKNFPVLYTDSSVMLSNLLRKTDTLTMLSGYGRSGQIVKYSDTAAMLSNRLKISDTLTMLNGYGRKGFSVQYVDTAAMFTNVLRKSGGTMTGSLILSDDPTIALGAATKNYVDNVSAGLFWKPAAKAATTANIVLSGVQTIDGISIIAGDTIFVKNQTSAINNGYYIASAGAWARASWGVTGTALWGSAVFVKNGGAVNGGTQWTNSNSTQPTIGVDNITFAQIAGAGVYTNGTYLSLTGNVFDVGSTYSSNWNTAYNRSGTALAFTPTFFTFTKQDATTLTVAVPTFNQNTTGTAASLSAILVSTLGGSGINNSGTLTWGAGGTLGTAAYTAASAYEVPLTFSAPLSRSVNTISITQAATAANGYLSSTDWNTFNNKQPAGAYLTGNQTITLSGAVTGAGTTAITTAYTGNVNSINSLVNAAGWLYNGGTGIFSYSTPTAAQVGAPSGSGTSTGTNTGDETTTRINALYGYTPANGANYLPLTGGTLTGSLTGTSVNLTSLSTINSSAALAADFQSNWTASSGTNDIAYFSRLSSAVRGVIGYSDITGAIYFGTKTPHPVEIRYGDAAALTITTGSAATFANTVTATNFIGPATGLTGTAASLSIGGNAGSVTNGVYTIGTQSIAGLKTFTDVFTVNATVAASNNVNVYNTSATGFGIYVAAGNTTNYALHIKDYLGTTDIADIKNGAINFYGNSLTAGAASFTTVQLSAWIASDIIYSYTNNGTISLNNNVNVLNTKTFTAGAASFSTGAFSGLITAAGINNNGQYIQSSTYSITGSNNAYFYNISSTGYGLYTQGGTASNYIFAAADYLGATAVTMYGQSASTSYTTGTLVVTGGVGVSGAIYANSTLNVAGAITGTLATAAQPNITSLGTLSNLTVTAAITGGSLIKSGGTSSQFLKADGSVDASTYLLSSNIASGTTNYVTKYTSATALGVSQILDNGTNVSINKGTVTANTRFQIRGTSAYTVNTSFPFSTEDANGILGVSIDDAGSISSKGVSAAYTAVTATYTIKSYDYMVVAISGSNYTITLPTAVGIQGKIYVIKSNGAINTTLGTTLSQTIDGATTKSLATTYSTYMVQSDNVNWNVIAFF